jgi:hypothetical protein
MKVRGYDGACEELAVHFLGVGPEADVQSLAQHIQDAVEEWFETREFEAKGTGQDG